MANLYLTDGVQPYHDPCATWFPLPSDVMQARLERQDLLPMPIHFAFLSSKMEDWIGWAKEMLAENGFVEILRAVGVLKARGKPDVVAYCWGRGSMTHSIDTEEVCHTGGFEKGKNAPYVRAAFLITSLSKFVFGGFLNHELMVECIPLAIRLVESMRLPLAPFSSVDVGEKTLKEYPMVKCGYTSGTTPLACSWIRKRKVKRKITLEVNGFLDDYGSFNFHAYKIMVGMFAALEVSLLDKTLPMVLGNQIVEFTARNSSHLEMLADIPPVPSSNKTNWNKAMRPYIDEVATTMWNEDAATLRKEEYGQVGVVAEELGQEVAGNARARASSSASSFHRLSFSPFSSPSFSSSSPSSSSSSSWFVMEPDAGFSSCSSWFFVEPRFGFRKEPNSMLDGGTQPGAKFIEETISLRNSVLGSSTNPEPRSGFREEPSSGFLGSSKNLDSGFCEEPLTNLEPRPLSTSRSVEKGKAKAVVSANKENEKLVTEESSSNSNNGSDDKLSDDKSRDDDTSSESENGSEQKGKNAGFQSSIDINRATLEEFELGVGDAAKKSILGKSKVDAGKTSMSSKKKIASPIKVEHDDEPSLAPAKSSEANNFAVRLLKNLKGMKKDRDVSLA
ncbi:hypothetical protein SLEP1_g27603 [Rubroshorea leprosula]|uniref:Uncharacterized protein n=1 Tax=Rubroshorea leprosula TaxID=152421 RepID=A0AAV5K3J9_9ROSI|nr:hypothetical protein SLEP1_g27603 [Rubroshorea leprosula]